MIKKRYLFLTGLALSLAGSGCERVETEPRDLYREDTVWDAQDRNAVVALYFLNDIYNYVPTGFARVGGEFLDTGTDDGVPSRTARTVEYYTNGTISTILNPDAYWSNSYYGIRKANIFLANIDKVPTTANNIKWWKSEARFIRALMYFELIKRYGGVPLIGDKIFTLEDDLSLPRNTYAECVNYIVNECDAIKGTLRVESAAGEYNDPDWGRISKGAALALKSRTLLYAASPLFNGGGIAGSTELHGYPSADLTRWQKAAEAAQEFFTSTGTYYTTGLPNFSNAFINPRKNP
ncbi:MAG TPA: RagB/SusD family nutrient uptake outer membrane protein, partial [Hymenobacter sp.]